ERFLREARLAAKLSHPNIIPIHAVDETDGFVYFVMAFVDGETLAHRVRTRGPLSGSEGSRVLREVAWALAYAHEQGVVHRDVKPDNILIETTTGRVLVADFGIAAATGDVADAVSGTPEFMSPEQALGREIGARSDLYALGATAFFAFSGRLPFEGRSATEILAKQVTEPAPPLGSLGLPVPRKLAAIVDRCLAKDADHRPASALALAEQLGVALEQRREVPVVLRAWVKRTARLDGTATLATGLAVPFVSMYLSTRFGTVAGLSSLFLGGVVAPFGYMVAAARRLRLSGFSHNDTEAAFAAEIQRTREELAVNHRGGPAKIERAMSLAGAITAASTATGISVAIVALGLGTTSPLFLYAMVSLGATGLVGLSLSLGLVQLARRHRDVDTEFWANVWKGRIGTAAFAVAKRLLGKGSVNTAMTHRATELSLGMAAEQLYESLPKEARRELAALPSLLQRLQRDAQILRRRHDDLQDALNDAGDAASSLEYAPVRDARDTLRDKLAETVSALETIRLNLLRLHAGSATVEGLTTRLGAAAEVAEDVARLIASKLEVDALLEYPREIATTPV
ncbi:MAG TPA: protein kinase, partial [Gemmatimonadaceae bacterium]